MIPGNPINIGGTDYTVPPINLRLDFEHAEAIDKLRDPKSGLTDREFAKLLKAPFVANLQRNYPDFKPEQFEDIAVANLADAFFAMLFKAGYSQAPLPAKPKEGETPSAPSVASSSAT